MAPVAPPYVPSQVKMYEWGSLYRFQGWIRMPRTPVIRPPVRKEIFRGQALEKSYDGLTMLAATLTDRVATARVNSAKATMIVVELAGQGDRSQIAVP
jgi:hypothetical protein